MDIYDSYEMALNIFIRPDLTVVVQVAAIDPSEDGSKFMRFYIQTLQMLLQEASDWSIAIFILYKCIRYNCKNK